MLVLLIDNYDSFTYNLVQRVGEIDASIDVQVVRNDRITLPEAIALSPDRLMISPGPCTPREAGMSGPLIDHFRGRVPILGICLGHQTMADRAGMVVGRHHVLMHGKTSEILHDGRGIFAGRPNPFVATRYHSLIVDRETLTSDFEVSAWTADDEIMGLRWIGPGSDRAPMEGVQFHPESYLTTEGPALIARFLDRPVPVRGPQ
ncbi:MAG: aminodeoxychorismate/anthranilate synthase component II [Phycisphaerales bacterium]|nr:aminodeoxychorismate/anthranilate synthase component II [Phycisphaerales bacterium]